jgi:hypothetical protein
MRTKQRVKDLGEVFTQKREVDNILNLTHATSNRYWRFLEPACGNGNFLVAILEQRLVRLKHDRQEWHIKNREFSILKILSTIYGVDIAEDNIAECKKRILNVIYAIHHNKPSKEFINAALVIMDSNIIQGDMLNGKEKIIFIEYNTPAKGMFKRQAYRLVDMETGVSKPVAKFGNVQYSEMRDLDLTNLYKKDIVITNYSENLSLFNTGSK